MKLEEVITEFHKIGLPELKEREIELPLDVNKAITVTGLRRTGKTYLLYQTIQKLLDRGREMREMFYINFEDERLEGMSSEDLSKIVELYGKYNPDSRKMYLFLDEIQAVNGWERFIRRLLERRNVHVFITGSSSRFLSRDIATSLRGRALNYHLFPLSFWEFLEFKGERFEKPLIEEERGKIMRHLEEYMEFGGFPEIVNYSGFYNKTLKIRTLQEYLDLILYKDLVERYGIEKTGAMKALIRVLIKNFGNRLSIRRLHEMLVSSGASLSKTKIYEYFSYLEDIGFVIPIRKFSYSEIKSSRTMPKLYLIDTGFPTVHGLKEMGRRMENMVAIELLRRKMYREPDTDVHFYLDSSGEVDFVISSGFEVKELIQVTLNLDSYETKRREIRALLHASRELKCRNMRVITWDYEGKEKVDGKDIHYIPLWKWLLEI